MGRAEVFGFLLFHEGIFNWSFPMVIRGNCDVFSFCLRV